MKKKQLQNNDSALTATAETNVTASITATITTATSSIVTVNRPTEEPNLPERRPSWRLKVDGGSKFQLEDANNKSIDTTAYIRRPTGTNLPRPSSAPENINTSTADTTVTLPLRRPLKTTEDKGTKKNVKN